MDKPQIHYIESSILAILFFVVLGIFVWLFYITFNVSLFLSTLIILSIFVIVFFLIKFSLKLKNLILFNEAFDAEYKKFRDVCFIYKRDVIKGEKSYIRFVNDYCNEIAIYPDKSKKRQAAKLLIKELLNTRKDLVEKYFGKEHFGYLVYLELIKEFNSTTKTELEPEKELPEPIAKPRKSFGGNFNDEQIEILTKCANELAIFTQTISKETMKAVFACELDKPLQLNNNTLLAWFFDTLLDRKLIRGDWKKISEDKKLFTSINGTLIKSSNLSSALSESRKNTPIELPIIKKYINQL